jgi:hypothetical protein
MNKRTDNDAKAIPPAFKWACGFAIAAVAIVVIFPGSWALASEHPRWLPEWAAALCTIHMLIVPIWMGGLLLSIAGFAICMVWLLATGLRSQPRLFAEPKTRNSANTASHGTALPRRP